MIHHLRALLATACATLLAVAMTGCASFDRIADYPSPTRQIAVAVVEKPMSKMSELPVGTYYDEARQIIVTGHQKGLFTGMLFGVVGVLAADQINKSAGRSRYGTETAKGADLAVLLDEMVATAVAENRAQHWAKGAADGSLRLTPYAVFTVEKTGEARLYAMLRAEILGNNGKPSWSGRYFARAPGLLPLQESGWMADEQFSKGMRVALGHALNACIDDTHGRLTGTETITVKGRFAFLNMDLELRAIAVHEDSDRIIAKLAVGDAMVMAGTHVLDRADYEIKPAKFKDPRK